ncbi:DUF1206 domain-containing protein [Hymenobacter profundi]|uniref:DUF1206 domain-containing protein n=1 Tax=Hymenobacter profundi TaxID=1982110 RepID=A0ABS6X0U8_9BACT|nr:DUF1206 domain-containing protein [Hymenobacter profundi]MBW3129455.1 DUF1206 domain-containing protein [Hymenobacter profundi]
MSAADTLQASLPTTPSSGIRMLARFGFAAKGVVYGLMGLLALLAATGQQEGQTTDKQKAVHTLQELPGGSILLGLIAFGLLGYIVWRLVQAFRDTEDKGDGAKGIARRVGYAASGLVYASLAWYAAQLAMSNSAGGSGNTKQTLTGKILSWPGGEWLIMLVGLITIGVGIYQIYRAYSGSFHKNVQSSDIPAGQQTKVYRLGQVGYTARGIVLGITGYFFVQAGLQSRATAVGDTEQAFDLLASMGPVVLGIVALGLIAYGLYMLVQAKYPVLKKV